MVRSGPSWASPLVQVSTFDCAMCIAWVKVGAGWWYGVPMQSLLPPKKDVALALLERASVFVHLDPRFEDVVVPPWLKAQSQLILQIGLNLAVNIPDLEVDAEGISCTLSFSRRPHYCHVPWAAVYALVGEDGRGMVWPSDIPADVAAQAQPVQSRVGRSPRVDTVAVAVDAARAHRHGAQTKPKQARGAQSKGPNLVALDGNKGGGSVAVSSPPPSSRRAHLRLVK